MLTVLDGDAPLTLADLEDFDPHAPAGKGERRFCCPRCGGDKRVDAAHRCLSLNTQTGEWFCHRCRAGGTLKERWTPRKERNLTILRRAFAVSPLPPEAVPTSAPATEIPPWRAIWDAARPLAGTPGAEYLAGRGTPADLATAAGARFSADCYGRPAVLFPLVDQSGAVVAWNGRHTDGRADPKAHSGGAKREGVFATPGALEAEWLVVTEAPIDALTLASLGVPAVALCGTSGPTWLLSCAVFRRVAIAFDADAPGASAAAELGARLASVATELAYWLPPAQGRQAKDWNEALEQVGAGAVRDYLAALGGAGRMLAADAPQTRQDGQGGPSPVEGGQTDGADVGAASGSSPLAEGLPDDVADPRPDLADDSAAWTALLRDVAGWIDEHPSPLDVALYCLRIGSLRLARVGDGYVLRPTIDPSGAAGWEDLDAWRRDRERHLLPHRVQLTGALERLPFAVHGRPVHRPAARSVA